MIAKIELTMYEGYIAQIYHEGKIILMQPIPEPGCPQRTYDTQQEAAAHIQACFPGASLVGERAFEEGYKQDGYHYPGEWSTLTNMLCRCGGWLRIDQGDQRSGLNAPYTSYRSTGYHCEQCPRQYLRFQNWQYGPINWQVKTPDGPYEYCEEDDPHDHQTQPFGFTETRLAAASKQAVK